MAKDYFQDIVPPEDDRPKRPAKRVHISAPVEKPVQKEEPDEIIDDTEVPDVGLVRQQNQEPQNQRSIRNISPSRERMRMSGEPREAAYPDSGEKQVGGFRRWGLWVLAAIAVVLVAMFGLFAFRDSTVNVIPRTQAVTFDETSHFAAYPDTTAATGTLQYKIITSDLDDSEPVAAQGMQHAETKASGSITVYNNYSTSPVKLVKSTRFQSTDGHIFRTPADINVPAKNGNTPGSVSVTVVADQAGADYNVAPTDFTLPGLASNPAMFKGVYAKSTNAFTGGFVGDQPAVDPATLSATISTVRGRLAQKAAQSAQANDQYVVFPNLSQVTYQSQPSTTEAGGGVRIHERAHVVLVAFPKDAFAQAVAKTVSADADNASITLKPGEGFGAKTTTPPEAWGTQMIDFSLTGKAQLVWNVDTQALANALANRHESAFQTIVTGFPSIQEAHARIQPFWKSTFPDASKIVINVVDPTVSQ